MQHQNISEIETNIVTAENDLRKIIYTVRGQQIMLDSDLAELYGIETSRLNQAVKRNLQRFPENFRFQLTKDEYDVLISQFVISKTNGDSRGGRQKLPFVFTEQGVAMLSAVLRSETAINVSIRIMESFVEMRKYMADTSSIHKRLSSIEAHQQKTDDKIEKIFEQIDEQKENQHRIFYRGQMYDAFSALIDIIETAEDEIILLDNYVDVNTLNLLAKKKKPVSVKIYTLRNTRLSEGDISTFNSQYPTIEVNYTNEFHDRFLVIDGKMVYHIGASLKDAGKKSFAINIVNDSKVATEFLHRISAL